MSGWCWRGINIHMLMPLFCSSRMMIMCFCTSAKCIACVHWLFKPSCIISFCKFLNSLELHLCSNFRKRHCIKIKNTCFIRPNSFWPFSLCLQHSAVVLQGHHGILAFIVQPVIIPCSVRGRQVKESPGLCVCRCVCLRVFPHSFLHSGWPAVVSMAVLSGA